MAEYSIFWADGSVREYPGIGSTAAGRIVGERGYAGAKVAGHLMMVDIILDNRPAPGLSREITVCIPKNQTVH